MSKIILVIVALIALITLAAPSAQKPPDIEPVNARWVQFFNSGDFDGIASLYTEDATALPPGSPMVRCNRGNVEESGGSSRRSRSENVEH